MHVHFLNTLDVAQRLGSTSTTVRNWIKKGELKASQFSKRGSFRIKEEGLQDFIKRCRKET